MSMFSVDINSAGGANYIQPKKGAKKKVATPQVPVDMTKNGSVFNDPNIFSPTATTTTSARTVVTSARRGAAGRGGQSIFNNPNINFISGGNAGSTSGVNGLITDPTLAPSSGNDGGGDDLGIGRDAGKGRQAAKELKDQTSDLKSGIRDTESDGDRAEALGKKGKKLTKTLKKTDEKFKETQQRQLNEFKQIEEDRKREIRQMRTASEYIEQYTQELEAELANSDMNMDRIATLRSQIREHSTTLQVGNQKVAVLGRSSKALTTQMNKTSNVYVKTNKAQQKELNKNSETLEKTIEVATKIEEISTIVETTGAIIENLGKIFKACASIPYVGAALAAAGAVMEPIGATGKAIGQWGKTAAQVVKTVAYASDGQIAMAFQCAASAIQSGMSAYSSTKGAINGWKQVDAELAQVKATAADAKADRAEARAAKAQEKADVANAEKGVDRNGKSLDGSAGIEGRTHEQMKADQKLAKAQMLRGDADIAQLDANYERAWDNLKATGATDAELEALNQEYTRIRTKGIVKGEKPDLLKGTSFDVDGVITKQADANLKARTDAFNQKKADAKAKSTLKKIFSKEGGAAMAQAMSLCGMVAAQIETPKCSSNCKKKGGVTNFQLSQRAQKIVAQTMGRMRYVRPTSTRWG